MDHMFRTITVRKGSQKFPRYSESSIIELENGILLGAWARFKQGPYGGDDQGNSEIMKAYSYDNGETWVDEEVFITLPEGWQNTYYPNFLRLPNGEILFFYAQYKQVLAGLPVINRAYVRRSADGGRTFSQPCPLWDDSLYGLAFANDTVRLLSNGRIIFPLNIRTGVLYDKEEHMMQASLYSDDGGRSFHVGKGRIDLPMRGAMEGYLEELSDGRLIMVVRSQLGSVFKAYSLDEGETWTKPQTLGLRCPESCNSIRKIPGTDHLILMWNDSEYDMGFASHYGKRSPLSVALSRDGGNTWKKIGDLENDPTYACSNASCTFLKNGNAVITYWSLPYDPQWRLYGLWDLKAALFRTQDLYR